jgi:hypothetical protein
MEVGDATVAINIAYPNKNKSNTHSNISLNQKIIWKNVNNIDQNIKARLE